MARGGARSRSGPAPTSTERSHKAKADQHGAVTLPAEGRDGAEPAYPLVDPNPRELDLWSRLWESPQAVMWEQLHLEFEVASYVRVLARAELPKSSSIIWGQAKQMAESLGLTASGMQRNRWTIGTVETEDDAPQAVAGVTPLAARLRAVQDG